MEKAGKSIKKQFPKNHPTLPINSNLILQIYWTPWTSKTWKKTTKMVLSPARPFSYLDHKKCSIKYHRQQKTNSSSETLNIKVTNKIHTISNGLLQFEKRAAAPGISKSYLIKCLNSFFNSFSSLTESFLMNSFARKILTQKTNCERKNFPKNFHVWGFSMNELFMWMFCGLFTIK